MTGCAQEIRFALRALIRNRLLSIAAIGALAIGIGTTTAVFGLANWILLRPIPGVAAADELAIIRFEDEPGRGTGISYANFSDLRRSPSGFSHLRFEVRRSRSIAQSARLANDAR
jgi:hypothetical protein